MNEDTKLKIIDGALSLFTQHGIKSITMDEIAESLSISKRTIYENFKDKNTLVFESLKRMDEKQTERINEISQKSENIVEEMLVSVQEFQCIMKGLSNKYLDDIKVLFSTNEYFQKKSIERQIKQEMKLAKGQEEGYIRKDVDPALISISIGDGIKVMTEKVSKENPNMPILKIIYMFVKIFFRGILTPKGMEILDNYERKNNLNTK